MIDFGHQLRTLRLEKELTHSGTASVLGVSSWTVNAWEVGRRTPTEERQSAVLAMLADYLPTDRVEGPEIVYGPVVEYDGSRVTRIRRVDDSTFTVRVPWDGMQSNRSTDVGWITEDDERSVAASDRLLSAVLGAA